MWYKICKYRYQSPTIISKCGDLAKVPAPLPKKTKLDKKMDCIFISCALKSSAYRFLIHKSAILDIHINIIIESRDVVFLKTFFS